MKFVEGGVSTGLVFCILKDVTKPELSSQKVPPFFSLDDGVVDEDVESDEDEDGSKLSGDEGVDTVEHGVIPEHTFQPRCSYN